MKIVPKNVGTKSGKIDVFGLFWAKKAHICRPHYLDARSKALTLPVETEIFGFFVSRVQATLFGILPFLPKFRSFLKIPVTFGRI